MFIELTDHLRCPADHPEAFLVLLPDRTEARHVIAGHLGCPVCGWSTAWTDGIPDFGGAAPATGAPPYDADAVHAMLGISGPGGWITLAGNVTQLVSALTPMLPGVNIVLINPADTVNITGASAIRSGAWPIKSHAMRGVVVGSDVVTWNDVALGSTLPGLRTVGCGVVPAGAKLLASADDVWVATHG